MLIKLPFVFPCQTGASRSYRSGVPPGPSQLFMGTDPGAYGLRGTLCGDDGYRDAGELQCEFDPGCLQSWCEAGYRFLQGHITGYPARRA